MENNNFKTNVVDIDAFKEKLNKILLEVNSSENSLIKKKRDALIKTALLFANNHNNRFAAKFVYLEKMYYASRKEAMEQVQKNMQNIIYNLPEKDKNEKNIKAVQIKEIKKQTQIIMIDKLEKDIKKYPDKKDSMITFLYETEAIKKEQNMVNDRIIAVNLNQSISKFLYTLDKRTVDAVIFNVITNWFREDIFIERYNYVNHEHYTLYLDGGDKERFHGYSFASNEDFILLGFKFKVMIEFQYSKNKTLSLKNNKFNRLNSGKEKSFLVVQHKDQDSLYFLFTLDDLKKEIELCNNNQKNNTIYGYKKGWMIPLKNEYLVKIKEIPLKIKQYLENKELL